MKIRVLHATKKTEMAVIDLPDTATVEDLNKEISKTTRIPKLRQRIVYDGKPLLFGKKIREHVAQGEEFEVTLKDLGPQLPYKTLFFLEYLGPLLTIPIGYLISKNRSDCAKFGAAIGFLHYLKRELESEYVHIFSNASVPVSGSFKNFFHYWLVYGLVVIGEIFFFKTKASDWPRHFYWVFAVIIAVFEFLNYKCHCVLRDLRTGSGGLVDPHKRGIPKGWGFDQVHCANYTWEILVWVTYTIMTKSWTSGLFTIMGVYMMATWSAKKKKMLLDGVQSDPQLQEKLKRKSLLIPGLY